MSLFELHDRALDALCITIETIDASQLGDPTPCAQFDVRALLNHLVSGNYRFATMAEGVPAPPAPANGDFVGDDAAAAYRASADVLSKAWAADPGLLERIVDMPFGKVPGEFAVGVHVVETVVHSWDLAKATGQPTDLDSELCEAAWDRSKGIDDSFRGPGRPFGRAVAAPPGATATETLVAWLGRNP